MKNRMSLSVVMACLVLLAQTGCDSSLSSDRAPNGQESSASSGTGDTDSDANQNEGSADMSQTDKIMLGAGCFWCIEAILERVDGVKQAVSGYTAGETENPTYQQVCSGTTGHAEVVEVEFDPQRLPLEKLLDLFWQLHDPTQLNRQGADVGTQYRSAIYYFNDQQRKVAEASKKKWDESGKLASPIVTEITKASKFYPAEEYHQEYFARNPGDRYCLAYIPAKLKKLGLLREDEK